MANQLDPAIKAKVIREYVESTDSIAVLAERLSVSRGTITRLAKEHGLVRKKRVIRKGVERKSGAKPAHTRDKSPNKLDPDLWAYDSRGIGRYQGKVS